MAVNESWARSLYNRKLKSDALECEWSEKYQTTIHRFNMGQRECHCGKIVVEERVTSGGWKRIPKGDTTATGKGSKTGHG